MTPPNPSEAAREAAMTSKLQPLLDAAAKATQQQNETLHAVISEVQRLVSLELCLREYVGELKAECADKGIAQPIAAAIRREIADRLESMMEGKP